MRQIFENEEEQGLFAPALPTKKCAHCGENKPYAEYHKNPQMRSGLQSWCKTCNRECSKSAYRNLDLDKMTKKMQRQRGYYLQENYGISQEEYNRLLHAQAGVCAVCGQEETKFNKVKNCFFPLAVDHHHETGKVRGLLCFNCNVAYGSLKEDPERIKALLAYHYRSNGEDECL